MFYCNSLAMKTQLNLTDVCLTKTTVLEQPQRCKCPTILSTALEPVEKELPALFCLSGGKREESACFDAEPLTTERESGKRDTKRRKAATIAHNLSLHLPYFCMGDGRFEF